MNSVDLFGFRRIVDNPAVNFIYLQGEAPCRDSVVKAIRNHHTIASTHFCEADVTLNEHIPGDVVDRAETAGAVLRISAKISTGVIKEVRVYAGSEVIRKAEPDTAETALEFKLDQKIDAPFIRVEAEGETPYMILMSTPFFLK